MTEIPMGEQEVGAILRDLAQDLMGAMESWNDVVFIGHGLTSETRAMLIDGTMDVVITQSPGGVVTSCARILANLHAHRPALAGVEPVRMSVYFRENLP